MELTRVTVGHALMVLCAVILFGRLVQILNRRFRLPSILKERPQIVDVRSAPEFASGHAFGSRNIPLGEMETGGQALDRTRWVVVCCASGIRSGTACRKLKKLGFPRVFNGGSWQALP